MVCPICQKQVTARDDPRSPNPFYPFCGDRCRLIDLGRWLSEKYQVPLSPPQPDEPDPPAPGDPTDKR